MATLKILTTVSLLYSKSSQIKNETKSARSRPADIR